MDLNVTDEIKKTLLRYVRLVIAEKLNASAGYLEADLDFSDSLYRQKFGAFVTLHINGKLRGCIGYIQGVKPLKETIHDMAIAAAFRDPRFSALSAQELEKIDIEISVLSPIEEVADTNDIVPGKDGLIISKGFSSGLLLPQVATEQGWDRETFLNHTCMKAGLLPGTWKESGVKIEKFSAFVFGEKEFSK